MQKKIDYEIIFDRLLQVKQCADNGISLLSNQGQPLDGYSELANYRSIINSVEKILEGKSDGKNKTL